MIIASVSTPTGVRKQPSLCEISKSRSAQDDRAERALSPDKHINGYGTNGDSPHESHSLPLRLQQIAHQRIQYPAFRESFFFDETTNPMLKGEGWEPDSMSADRESQKHWSSGGRSISSRLPKTAVPPGSAFRNECLSPDQLYSSSRGSLGYEVTRSLRGSSLCSTTKRFEAKTVTQESVGPGSYNVLARNWSVLHVSSPESSDSNSERLKEWGNSPADPRQMDSAGEWKLTSEKPSPTNYSFRRAPGLTWIEQVEQRQRRSNPHARAPPATLKSPAEQRMPNFLQGVRNPVHTKHSALIALAGKSTASSSTSGMMSPGSPRSP